MFRCNCHYVARMTGILSLKQLHNNLLRFQDHYIYLYIRLVSTGGDILRAVEPIIAYWLLALARIWCESYCTVESGDNENVVTASSSVSFFAKESESKLDLPSHMVRCSLAVTQQRRLQQSHRTSVLRQGLKTCPSI